jgi:hypothetical protein
MSELAAIEAISEDNTAGVFSLSADTLAVLLFALGFIHDISAWRDFPDEPLSDADIDKIDSLIANATYEVMTPVTIPDPAIYPDNFKIVAEDGLDPNLNYSVLVTNAQMFAHQGEVTPIADGNSYIFPFFCRAGTYDLKIRALKGLNFGKTDIYVDSDLQSSGVDWYNFGALNSVQQTISITVPSDGNHHLVIVVNGKNATSSSFRFVFVSAVGYVND